MIALECLLETSEAAFILRMGKWRSKDQQERRYTMTRLFALASPEPHPHSSYSLSASKSRVAGGHTTTFGVAGDTSMAAWKHPDLGFPLAL
jgi:hypothetical protein